jgi:RimJ/RimL family protein N-acetyltransferase
LVEIRTDRLILRPFEPEDLPRYAAINADPLIMQYLGGPLSRDASDAQAIGANAAFDAEGFGKIAIERARDGVFLGMCGLSVEPWYPQDLEIGWRLARDHWHQGYATEAARAWLGYAFGALGRVRVISVCDVPNVASIAVMRRIGMVFDHEAQLSEEGVEFAAVVYAKRRHA